MSQPELRVARIIREYISGRRCFILRLDVKLDESCTSLLISVLPFLVDILKRIQKLNLAPELSDWRRVADCVRLGSHHVGFVKEVIDLRHWREEGCLFGKQRDIFEGEVVVIVEDLGWQVRLHEV